MERNFYNDDFEQLVRQKADQYKMYPSDQVWKGIYKSIHGRRRWHWAGLAVLLIGVGIYSGNYYLAGKPANKIARNMETSINATNNAPDQNNTAAGNTEGQRNNNGLSNTVNTNTLNAITSSNP